MIRSFIIALSSTIAITSASAAPDVVVSIMPLHSLTTGVMKGVGKPELLLDGTTSPHDFNLKPSQAQSLQDSDVVIWIGEGLETFMIKSMHNHNNKQTSLELMDVKELKLYDYRNHEEHHEEHKEHEEHSEHAEEDGHDHEEEHESDHAKHDDHGHAEGGKDPHIWLDIDNAKKITTEIARILSENDAENAAAYQENAVRMIKKLDTLDIDIRKQTKDSQKQSYVVFHDAYQYFEKHFGLAEPFTITLNPEIQPSAARIKDIQKSVSENNVSCIFSEPQFSPKTLSVVAENTSATISTLDPLGSNIEQGEEHYFNMMRNLAKNFSECLSK